MQAVNWIEVYEKWMRLNVLPLMTGKLQDALKLSDRIIDAQIKADACFLPQELYEKLHLSDYEAQRQQLLNNYMS